MPQETQVSIMSSFTFGVEGNMQIRNNNGFGMQKTRVSKVWVFQEQLCLKASTKILSHINGEAFQTKDSNMMLAQKD